MNIWGKEKHRRKLSLGLIRLENRIRTIQSLLKQDKKFYTFEDEQYSKAHLSVMLAMLEKQYDCVGVKMKRMKDEVRQIRKLRKKK